MTRRRLQQAEKALDVGSLWAEDISFAEEFMNTFVICLYIYVSWLVLKGMELAAGNILVFFLLFFPGGFLKQMAVGSQCSQGEPRCIKHSGCAFG